MKKNMFNTVKKGIIRSAALLLVAGFCGNVGANLDGFLTGVTLDDQYSARMENQKKVKLSTLNKVDDIKVGESINPTFNPLLQRNYDLYMTLDANKGKDLEAQKTAYKQNLGYLDSLLGDKAVADYKPSDDGDVGYIKNIFQALYTNTSLLQRVVYYANKDKVATQALKDINNVINDHGVEIDDLDNTDKTATNVQTAINSLVIEAANAQTAKADAENNLTALLNWNDKDKNPAVANFGGSALNALVEELKAPKVLSDDEVKTYQVYKDLSDDYGKLQDNLEELNTFIEDLNELLVGTKIAGIQNDVSKIKNNFDILLSALANLNNQLTTAEANKVDVNTLGQDDLKNNPYVQKTLDSVKKLADTLSKTVNASNLLKADKDTLNAELNKAIQAKEKAEKELNDLKAVSGKLINAKDSKINELSEQIAALDKEIASKENKISTLEEQNKELSYQITLLKGNSTRLTSQLSEMQKRLQLAGNTNTGNTNNFENDYEEELDDKEESSTPLDNQSVKSEEPEAEEEQVETLSPSINAEDDDFDFENLLKDANSLIEETQKPSTKSATKTETQKKHSASAASQPAAKTESKTNTKTQSKKDEIYKELFGDYVTPGNDDNPYGILEGIDTEGAQVFNISSLLSSSVTSKTEKKDSKSKRDDDFIEGLGDLI